MLKNSPGWLFCMSSLKKEMYSLVSNIRHSTYLLVQVFLNVFILSWEKVLIFYICLIFFFPVFSSLFYRVDPINSLQATVVKLSTFCSSWLPLTNFRQFVQKNDSLSSAFQCFYDIESNVCYSSTRSLKIKSNSSHYTHDYPLPCYLRLNRSFSANEFQKIQKFVAS